jgi:predicted DNA-binding transcriptional regulator YafY
MRRYLVARDEDRDAALRHFRVDRISAARLLGSSFTRQPGFDIAAHAARAFGSYQDEARYGEVVWRFSPAAAPTAREFVFHPDQRLEDQPDGALVVRFHASGWLEMAWHVYQWGDAVEVLAPEALRRLVEGHRRNDFEALP